MLSDDVKTYFEYKKKKGRKKERKELLFLKYIQNAINQISLLKTLRSYTWKHIRRQGSCIVDMSSSKRTLHNGAGML